MKISILFFHRFQLFRLEKSFIRRFWFKQVKKFLLFFKAIRARIGSYRATFGDLSPPNTF
jgi:hypothetical protein